MHRYYLIVLIPIILCSCYGTPPIETNLRGKTIPNFSIQLADSVRFFNTSQIPKGKSFVIFYFSPVCPYCKAQTTEIIEDMERLNKIQFYFVTSFPISFMKNYYQEFKLQNYPNILIGRDTAGLIKDYFEIPGVPYMAIYGKDKKLNQTFMGKIYSSQIKKVAEK